MSVSTRKKDRLEYEVAECICVPHAFTTRLGGVSTGSLSSLNIAYKEGETMANVEENIRILASGVGFDPEKLVLTRQTHSDIVRVVTADNHTSLCHRDYPECDALVTCQPGVSLLVFTADCTPILFHDPVTGAVGAAHAGWRGTAQNIAGKVVAAMAENFGCQPGNIRAAIGPNIAQCHFETDADVPQALEEAFGPEVRAHILTRNGKFYPDLKAVNALALRRAGVKSIEISDSCTACQSERFWSHRITKGDRGSQGAVITCGGKTL